MISPTRCADALKEHRQSCREDTNVACDSMRQTNVALPSPPPRCTATWNDLAHVPVSLARRGRREEGGVGFEVRWRTCARHLPVGLNNVTPRKRLDLGVPILQHSKVERR